MHIIKKIIVFAFTACIFLFSYISSFARGGAEVFGTSETAASEQQEKYVITNVVYEITGLVLEAALEEKLRIKTGQHEFFSEVGFLDYIEIVNQKIVNIRALETTSRIEYEKVKNEEKKPIRYNNYRKSGGGL